MANATGAAAFSPGRGAGGNLADLDRASRDPCAGAICAERAGGPSGFATRFRRLPARQRAGARGRRCVCARTGRGRSAGLARACAGLAGRAHVPGGAGTMGTRADGVRIDHRTAGAAVVGRGGAGGRGRRAGRAVLHLAGRPAGQVFRAPGAGGGQPVRAGVRHHLAKRRRANLGRRRVPGFARGGVAALSRRKPGAR